MDATVGEAKGDEHKKTGGAPESSFFESEWPSKNGMGHANMAAVQMSQGEWPPLNHVSFKKSKWVFPKIWEKPPNHPILIGFSIINHPFWGTPIFGNTQMKEMKLIL